MTDPNVEGMMYEMQALSLIQIEFIALMANRMPDPEGAVRALADQVNRSIDSAPMHPAMEVMLARQRAVVDRVLKDVRLRIAPRPDR